MHTIRDLLQRSADWLKSKGGESPRVDAEFLLAELLGMKRIELYMHSDRPLEASEVDRYRAMIERRGEGEPVAYILGTQGFWTLDLAVDKRVLIPRPETERIVELVLSFTSEEPERAWRIVDVGTGSGALALALASELPNATVLATDISSDALEVARMNAERCELRGRVRLVQGDLLGPLASPQGTFERRVDIVVSNPPYVGTADEMGPGVAEFEPGSALFAGADGLDILRRLVPQAAQVLTPEGAFFCEFGASQGAAVRALASERFSSVEIVKDYADHDRVLAAASPR